MITEITKELEGFILQLRRANCTEAGKLLNKRAWIDKEPLGVAITLEELGYGPDLYYQNGTLRREAFKASLLDADSSRNYNERGMLAGASYGEIRAKMTGGRADPNKKQVGGDHYRKAVVQHWDFVTMHKIPYLEAVAIKYLMRHRDKGGREDIEKAIHFCEKILEGYDE